MDKYKTSLERVVEAWDELPEGKYYADTIQNWLKFAMAPAIRNARETLNDE